MTATKRLDSTSQSPPSAPRAASLPAAAPVVVTTGGTAWKVAKYALAIIATLAAVGGAVALSLVTFTPTLFALVIVGTVLAGLTAIAAGYAAHRHNFQPTHLTLEEAQKKLDLSQLGAKSGYYLHYGATTKQLTVVYLDRWDRMCRAMGNKAYAGTHLATVLQGLQTIAVDKAKEQVRVGRSVWIQGLELPIAVVHRLVVSAKKTHPNTPFMQFTDQTTRLETANTFCKQHDGLLRWNLHDLYTQLQNDASRYAIIYNGKRIDHNDLLECLGISELFQNVRPSEQNALRLNFAWKIDAELTGKQRQMLQVASTLQQGVTMTAISPLSKLFNPMTAQLTGKKSSDEQQTAREFINQRDSSQLPSPEKANLRTYLYNARACLPSNVQAQFPADFKPAHKFSPFITTLVLENAENGFTVTAHQQLGIQGPDIDSTYQQLGIKKPNKNKGEMEFPLGMATVQIKPDGSTETVIDFV